MTIDEAIAHAREVADTCEYEASKYDMSDSYESQVAYQEGKCSEEHEQLAMWLEELKAYREIGTVEEYKNSVLDIPKAYNKAIDNFAENISLKISDSFIWGKIADCFKSKNINDTSDEIIVYVINIANEIAEQLKKKI